jgi:hypothetical protein
MAESWRVVENRERGRVLAEGNERDMRTHVERNFPRVHVDPGAVLTDGVQADVHLVGPAGQKEQYLGPEEETPWVNADGED